MVGLKGALSVQHGLVGLKGAMQVNHGMVGVDGVLEGGQPWDGGVGRSL